MLQPAGLISVLTAIDVDGNSYISYLELQKLREKTTYKQTWIKLLDFLDFKQTSLGGGNLSRMDVSEINNRYRKKENKNCLKKSIRKKSIKKNNKKSVKYSKKRNQLENLLERNLLERYQEKNN